MKFITQLLYHIVLIITCGKECKVQPPKQDVVYKAVCVLLSPFNNVNGVITFERMRDGILVTGRVNGLCPGLHGFHIHEKGDIRDPKCSTVGGHFNPLGEMHGAPEDKLRHIGDLGNINADDSGTAIFSFTDKLMTLNGPNSIIGRSLVVHQRMDDLGRSSNVDSKISGDAGERLVCGVIGYG